MQVTLLTKEARIRNTVFTLPFQLHGKSPVPALLSVYQLTISSTWLCRAGRLESFQSKKNMLSFHSCGRHTAPDGGVCEAEEQNVVFHADGWNNEIARICSQLSPRGWSEQLDKENISPAFTATFLSSVPQQSPPCLQSLVPTEDCRIASKLEKCLIFSI